MKFFILMFCSLILSAYDSFILYDESIADRKKVDNFALDRYVLSFDPKSSECSLTLNGSEIDLFDKSLGKKVPRNSYDCFTIQKENYISCIPKKEQQTTSLFLSYGRYDFTNFILAFHGLNKKVSASVTVECSKKHRLF